MEQKNYTEVLIDGTIYTLGGTEGEPYLQKVAAYLNDKIGKIRKQSGFSKQSTEYQALMIELNIADDYFKEQERADLLAEQKAAMEKDAYSLKHELITTQMKMESDQEELKRLRKGEEPTVASEDRKRLKRELEEARQAQKEAEREAEEARQAQKEAEREAEEARQAQKEAENQAQELKEKLDAVKGELEQLKAIHAAAAAAAGHVPHR